MTELDTMRARAEALHLHGLLAHWPEVATEAWVAPLLGWEEQERARRSLERRLGSPSGAIPTATPSEPLAPPPTSGASSRCATSIGPGPSAATAPPSRR